MQGLLLTALHSFMNTRHYHHLARRINQTLLLPCLRLKTKYFDVSDARVEVRPADLQIDVDVFIPFAAKDRETLPLVIHGLRKNVRHNISTIYLVAAEKKENKILCASLGCNFVDEASVLPIRKTDIHYLYGSHRQDRSGWLFQQLLKLSCEEVSTAENILIVDADTILIRPQYYFHNGIAIMNVSDEFYIPWFLRYEKVYGRRLLFPISFTSHQMLYERDQLREMKASIVRRHDQLWFEVLIGLIDSNEKSVMSEQDFYGHHVLSVDKKRRKLVYWKNIRLERAQVDPYEEYEERYASEYKSVSIHKYAK
mgnify:CR=1 FL=1